MSKCFKMSDFVINCSRFSGRAEPGGVVERDGQDGGDRGTERRHAEINERDTEELEKSDIVVSLLFSDLVCREKSGY